MNTASSSSSKYSNESGCHSYENYSYHPSSGYEQSSHHDTLAPKFDVYFQEYLGYVNKFMFKLPQDDFKGCWDDMDTKYIHPDTMKDINRIMINQMENCVNLSEKLNDCQTIIRRLDSIRASSLNKPRFCVWADEDEVDGEREGEGDHLRKDLLLRRTIKDMLHEVEDIENKSSEYAEKLIEENKYLKQRLDKCDYYQNNLLDEIETLKALIKEYKLSDSSIDSLCRYSLQEYNNKTNQCHSEHEKVQERINYWYNRDFPGNGVPREMIQICHSAQDQQTELEKCYEEMSSISEYTTELRDKFNNLCLQNKRQINELEYYLDNNGNVEGLSGKQRAWARARAYIENGQDWGCVDFFNSNDNVRVIHGCDPEIAQISDCCSTDSINVHAPSNDVMERNNDMSNNISSVDEWSQVNTP